MSLCGCRVVAGSEDAIFGGVSNRTPTEVDRRLIWRKRDGQFCRRYRRSDARVTGAAPPADPVIIGGPGEQTALCVGPGGNHVGWPGQYAVFPRERLGAVIADKLD